MKTKTEKSMVGTPLVSASEAQLTPPRMITRKEVAAYLKVSVQSIINYTTKGYLTSYKIGHRVLYNEAEVIATVQSCAVKCYKHEPVFNHNFKK